MQVSRIPKTKQSTSIDFSLMSRKVNWHITKELSQSRTSTRNLVISKTNKSQSPKTSSFTHTLSFATPNMKVQTSWLRKRRPRYYTQKCSQTAVFKQILSLSERLTLKSMGLMPISIASLRRHPLTTLKMKSLLNSLRIIMMAAATYPNIWQSKPKSLS